MHDSFKVRSTLEVGGKRYAYWSLPKLGERFDIKRLPYSMRILLENLLRHEDGVTVTAREIEAVCRWEPTKEPDTEIAFMPARVVLQDFTGVPCVVDLAAMRDAIGALGGDPDRINPLVPAELVIDHSVQVDVFGQPKALEENVAIEFGRNQERYSFLRWGQKALDNFKVVPPKTGIVHQVNLEHLARVVMAVEKDGEWQLFPDTVYGTDSHTTMINGIGVLGWGVGGIEAEAAMLGQPSSMLIPQVVGFKLSGRMPEGATATDLVLTVTQMLRKHGVVNKFVEFYGPGLDHLPLADRATIANMAPEYGATCGIFPVDEEALNYLRLSGRPADHIALVAAYAKAQGLWRDANSPEAVFSSTLELDMGTVRPSLAGPKRPQDRVLLEKVGANFAEALKPMAEMRAAKTKAATPGKATVTRNGRTFELGDGAVVIAAITSCTNTSNPAVMLGAGLLARNAVAKGLGAQPWVKTSLGPGSLVVTDYLKKANVLGDLEQLGFHVVGYGCTTCIGNSGPLPPEVSRGIADGDLVVASVLSGNRNFEGRVHPEVKANYLASPPLCVAYAIAGTVNIDLSKDPLGTGKDGKPVYLRDIWPSNQEIGDVIAATVGPEMFTKNYANVFAGDSRWNAVASPDGARYRWDDASTYIKNPPYFDGMTLAVGRIADIHGARARRLRRFDHHRPHLSRRRHQGQFAGRQVPDRARGGKGRLQLLRRAARQRRRDGARHLRQHPDQEPDAGWRGRRQHPAPAQRRQAFHLRRRHAIQGRGRAAGGAGRQGVRHRLVARLGGQGHHAARGQGRDRRELRAHPPLQPGGHGRAAAVLHARRECADAGAQGRRGVRLRHARRWRLAQHRGRRPRQRRRETFPGQRAVADAQGSRVLPPRRHPQIRPAPARRRRQGGLIPPAVQAPPA